MIEINDYFIRIVFSWIYLIYIFYQIGILIEGPNHEKNKKNNIKKTRKIVFFKNNITLFDVDILQKIKLIEYENKVHMRGSCLQSCSVIFRIIISHLIDAIH